MLKFAKLKQLKSLRLVIHHGDLDSFDSSMPRLESVRKLQLELFPVCMNKFVEVMPWIFPNLELLNVECYDQNTIGQLTSRLPKTGSPFGKLIQHNIYYQRDLSHYFSGHGYIDMYRAYMQEHLGIFADFL